MSDVPFPESYTVEGALRRAVLRCCREPRSPRTIGKPHWFYVASLFGMGRTRAYELCVWAGVDPDARKVAR